MSHFIFNRHNRSNRLNETFAKIRLYFYSCFRGNHSNVFSFRQTDRQNTWATYQRKLAGFSRDPSGDRHRFFRYFSEKHDHSEHTKETTLSEHSSILTRELKENRSKQDGVEWKD